MRRSPLLLLPLLAVLLFPGAAFANTIYVAPDVVTGGNSCGSPDFNDIQPAVTAASSGDTILICLSGTPYSGNVTIGNKSLVFQGEGTGNTVIDGSGKRFGFLGTAPQPLTFRDLTIRNTSGGGIPNRGGGITAQGALSLEGVVIDNAIGTSSGVSGGAVTVWSGNLNITDSRIEDSVGERGGIYIADDVSVVNSVVRNNTTRSDGGGIQSFQGRVFVSGSTISGNKTPDRDSSDGGGIYAAEVQVRNSTFASNFAGDGGGAIQANGITVTNSTVWKNSAYAGSAFYSYQAPLNILSSTISDNPSKDPRWGAIHTYDADVSVANSIISESGIGCDIYLRGHQIQNGGGNVVTNDTSGCDALVGPGPPSGKVTRAALALSPPADNGGPTETMALGSTSVAISAALDAKCPDLDQRGYGRPPGLCDAGAFEFGGIPPIASFQLSVSKDGGGGGRVQANAGALDCGDRCTEDYEAGATISLSQQANIGSDFAGWSGACAGADDVCTLTMDEAKDVVANFVVSDWLRASTSGDGNGVVTSDPGGINCGEICDAEYSGEVVQLVATPAPDSIFTGWSGACEGVDECLIDFSETSQAGVDANFALKANRRPTLDKVAPGRVVGVKVNVACAVADTCTVRLSGNRKGHPKQSFSATNVDTTIDGTNVFIQTTQTMRKAIRRAWKAGKNPIALLNAQQVDGGRRSISFLIKKR